jgi:hypothetical protein
MKKIIYLLMLAATICGCAKNETDAPGSIYGVITDKATGEPIQSAGVQLNSTGVRIITGSEGQYEFKNLTPGYYSINVTKTGYADLMEYGIYVAAGTVNEGGVQLEKLPPSLRVTDDAKNDIYTLDFGSAVDDVSRSFSIFNDGPESLEWQLTETSEWITDVSKTEGTLNAGATQAVIITIDRYKLAADENTTTIHVTSNNGSKQLTVMAYEDRKLPEVSTLDVTGIGSSTATLNGKIIETGYPAYTEHGFVYGTTPNPTIENGTKKTVSGSTGSFSAVISELTLGATYYVRAYATNSKGIAYSTNEVSFTTETVLPEVTTQNVSDINVTSARLNGTVEKVGDPAYTERGFVYSTASNPTVESNTKKTVSGTGTGAFFIDITDLAEGTTYYVRAYATNSKGTVYGQEVSFKPEIYVVLPTAGIAVQKTDITSNEINWTNANALCNNSTLAGYTDWRLPTIDELGAMFNNKDIVGGYRYDYYYDYDYYYVHYYYYWSSTKKSGYSYYMLLNMTTGTQTSDTPSNSSGYYGNSFYHCRCVRSLSE